MWRIENMKTLAVLDSESGNLNIYRIDKNMTDDQIEDFLYDEYGSIGTVEWQVVRSINYKQHEIHKED